MALDVLGQQPDFYRLNNQICSIYPVSNPSTHNTIVRSLRGGLDREVVNEGSSAGNTGVSQIVPSGTIPLVVKDLRQHASAPTVKYLRESNFRMSMIDHQFSGNHSESAPVFALQANLITGGLIRTTAGQHNVMDMTGQDSAISWMSKACHGTPFTEKEISIGNMDRTKKIPLLGDNYTPGSELDEQMIKNCPGDTTEESALPPANLTWAYKLLNLWQQSQGLQGEMAVAICLREEDWEQLGADEELEKYAAYIG
ncbi:hypothetical protein N7513_006542 [Penicillium frequentans]|nr:hypothetical protein N7513_006542 [Penicillium glabrum]